MPEERKADESADGPKSGSVPSISLPKGGGAIRGMGEKFAANQVTGTGSMTVPIAVSPGRSDFSPQLLLSYNSGSGNGPFGLGWSLSLPAITRKTDKGLPRYDDANESDVFLLSGAEDLVPVLVEVNSNWQREVLPPRVVGARTYRVQRYRPRIEGLFARIERWTNDSDPSDTFWRSISKDNVTTFYGKDSNSRVSDPADPTCVFSWLICESHDDKGNAMAYAYKAEDGAGVDLAQPCERNRGAPEDPQRKANRYLKRIRYGNTTPFFPTSVLDAPPTLPTPPAAPYWLFEVVLDYGEHDGALPLPTDDPTQAGYTPWPARADPFSVHRSGFDVRTYRLCRRFLMFHHFPNEDGVGNDCLVRSTDLEHSSVAAPLDTENLIFCYLLSVTQAGYKRQAGGYTRAALPPLEFAYSRATIQSELREFDPASVENLPVGLDGTSYQWVDLDGEGLNGVLSEQAGAWFYKRNTSPTNRVPGDGGRHLEARFAPLEQVAARPTLALADGRAQFMDLAGNGRPDLVTLEGPAPGFYQRSEDVTGWENFRPFRLWPNVNARDPNLKFIDLDGDGHTDILVTEEQVFRWHPALAEEGFGPARWVHQALDEETGPRLVFADGTQSIYAADMSGDGLTDLVRIRNGEVCYWPNLGYGRFGAKVTMGGSPWFDAPDLFDHRRLQLADIDGSGVTDIIYLHGDGIRLYFNQSGNSWSAPRVLPVFPRTDSLTTVTVVDLFGDGTACLVWSSPLSRDAWRPMRYLDLIGGTKPHLLVKIANNLGAETAIAYAPSTRFYVQDRENGTPWVTRLPFPVHVVERVETYDRISRNRSVTRYAYHHGYFDGVEREFRGFGMVEQWDTEEFAALTAGGTAPGAANEDAASHVPPVLTRTWFHTGAFFERGRISRQFEREYYGAPAPGDSAFAAKWTAFAATLLPDTVLPAGLTLEEEREACRALKGSTLRQEVYALDGSPKEQHPYTVTEQNFAIRVLQPRGGNRHGVFLTHARESIAYHTERVPDDPRVGHTMTLEVDDFGNVLQSTAIGYGRCATIPAVDGQGHLVQIPNPGLAQLDPRDQESQTQILITYTANRVTSPVEADDAYRVPLPCESRTYELTGLSLQTNCNRFTFDEVAGAAAAASEIGYHEDPTSAVQKRTIEHVRTYYRQDDLAGCHLLGTMGSLALPFETYKLAFTPGLLAQVYGNRVTDAMLGTEGGYVHSEGDLNWWIPSGRVFYSQNTSDTPAQELILAEQHFFLTRRYRDPFHTSAVSTETTIAYDIHDLLMVETCDALGNHVAAENDYRVLQPRQVMDPNGNRTQVAFDALGMVVGTAVMGKQLPAPVEGDSLTGFVADLAQADVDGLFAAADPHTLAQGLLRDATTRIVYDLDRFRRTHQANPNDPAEWQPPCAATLGRETHVSVPLPPQGLKIQLSFSYSDGFGREIQKKIQAEPGPVVEGSPVVSPRWVGSGWTVFNNKGKPVRQYEPFFSARRADDGTLRSDHRFEFGRKIGVSPVLFYDPVGRVVATLHPNHSWEKVVFDAWQQESWDVSDTVCLDPKTDVDVGGHLSRLDEAEYAPTWYEERKNLPGGDPEADAAKKTTAHAGTFTTMHFDALGRTFLTVAKNRVECKDHNDDGKEEDLCARVELDIEGNERSVRDSIVQAGDLLGRIVMRYDSMIAGPPQEKEHAAENRIHQASMEAGERWTLNDVGGKPIRSWDSRGQCFRTTYDLLRRPTRVFFTGADSDDPAKEFLTERLVYGEQVQDPEALNLRGKLYLHLDQAGAARSEAYDFKGNLTRSSRRIAAEYKKTVDWSTADAAIPADPKEALGSGVETAIAPMLEARYDARTWLDALNRPIQATAPHDAQSGMKTYAVRRGYNEANLLEKIDAWLDLDGEPPGLLDAASADLHTVTNIDYNAKGQRILSEHGNGVTTSYEYDPNTFRLTHLATSDGQKLLQDLRYTYDPAGNITRIRDDAQQTVYFDNQVVEPVSDYTYDALYRLIAATGREHLGQVDGKPIPHSYNDGGRVGLAHPADGRAMGRYIERYTYDGVGNFLEMKHVATQAEAPGWRRTYAYNEESTIEPNKRSNRLSSTTVGDGNPVTETYSYDAHGSMLQMLHLAAMDWDVRDQLHRTQRQVVNEGPGESTWYVYDAAGERVRKVTELASGIRKDERIYLGGLEVYRKPTGTDGGLVRDTLHILDDKQRVALVEIRNDVDDGSPQELVRYQHGNHLGSVGLELDKDGDLVSYEEFSPYGSTTFQMSKTQTPKRYRYTSKERDEESGLSHHGARYYAAWLGRWTSADPHDLIDGSNLFGYVRAFPVSWVDPSGLQGEPSWWETVIDIGTDFIPFVGGGKDVYRGLSSGDPLQVAIGVGSIALDVVAFGGGSLIKGGAKTLAKQLAKSEVKATTTHILQTEAKKVISTEAKQAVKTGVTQSVKTEVKQGVKTELKQSGLNKAVPTKGTGSSIGSSKSLVDPKKVAKYQQQGRSKDAAISLASPYKGMGEHMIKRSWLKKLPEPLQSAGSAFIESRFNKLSGSGLTKGEFYELHFRVDFDFHGASILRGSKAETWSGSSLGLTKLTGVKKLWFGTPTPTKALLGGTALRLMPIEGLRLVPTE